MRSMVTLFDGSGAGATKPTKKAAAKKVTAKSENSKKTTLGTTVRNVGM